MDVDCALERLGRCGRWQRTRWVLLGLSTYSALAVHILVIIFAGQRYTHHCALPSNLTVTASIPNRTADDGEAVLESCVMYVDDANSTGACPHGWHYVTPEGGSSIVSEFNLVCTNDYLSDLSQTVFTLGLSASNLFIAVFSDRYGRKRVHVISLLLLTSFSLMLACAPDVISFIILRFFVGVFVDGSFSSGFILLCEHFPHRYRGTATSLLLIFWVIGELFLTSVSMGLPNWRHLQLAISAPGIVFALYFCLIDESIPWLAATGKPEKAEALLKKAARVNNITGVEWDILTGVRFYVGGNSVTETDKEAPPTEAQPRGLAALREFKRETLLDICKHRRLCGHLIIISLIWFVNTIVNQGIVLSIGVLAGNLHMNMYILSAFDVVSFLLVIFLSYRWGTKIGFCVCHVIAGIALLSVAFVPRITADGKDLSYLVTFIVMTGKVAITTSFNSIVFYTPEVFPTQTRNLTFGIAMAVGRIGSALAPFYAYLARLIPWLPSLIFGIFSILSGMLGLYLPDTRVRPMFQSIDEMEVWTRRRSIISSYSTRGKDGRESADTELHRRTDTENTASLMSSK